MQRIIKEHPSSVRTQAKSPSKITQEMATELLYQLEEQSSSTLKEMTKLLFNKFWVQVSTQAVSNLLRDMDVTWKKVTNSPNTWNNPNILQQKQTLWGNKDLIWTALFTLLMNQDLTCIPAEDVALLLQVIVFFSFSFFHSQFFFLVTFVIWLYRDSCSIKLGSKGQASYLNWCPWRLGIHSSWTNQHGWD